MSEAKEAAKRLAAPILAKGFKPQALHTYRDPQGNPIFWRIRAKHPETGEKWIRPMHLNGTGYQVGEPKLVGLKPIYNLDRIAKAEPHTPVYIVEGEWAADHLTRLGILNTTSGGADSADRADWAPLKGRECIIWRDKDEAGRAYADAVAAKLAALGCEVSELDVDDLGLSEKGDAVDWLAANPKATAAEVLALPRVEPHQATNEGAAVGSAISHSGALLERVELIRADTIKPEAVAWLWNGYLAAGKVHIIAGAPGTGKTTLALGLMASLTSGGRWPDGSPAPIASGLIWSGEDSLADTLVPRLIASGANLSRVHFVGECRSGDCSRYFDPATDFAALEADAARMPNLRLVIVDPIVSAVSGDSNKNAEVRRGLQPLVRFAERIGCAVLGISHYSKGTAGRDPVERVTGSVAFGALARLVLGTAKVPDEDGGGRLLVRAKSNIGPDGGGFKYELRQVEIEGGITATRPEWLEALEGEARVLLAAAEVPADLDRDETQGAVEWLRETLRDGELVKSEVMRRGNEAGFRDRTIQRARERIGAQAVVSGFGKDKRSVWRLPIRAAEQSIVPIVPASEPGMNGTNGGTNARSEVL